MGFSDTLKVKNVVAKNYGTLDGLKLAALQRLNAMDKQAEKMMSSEEGYNEMVQKGGAKISKMSPKQRKAVTLSQLKDAQEALSGQLMLQFNLLNIPKPGCYTVLGPIFRLVMFAFHFILALAPFYLFICK